MSRSRIIDITHITTKQDMSRWTRAHADVPGIRWSVFAGSGGTMIIVEFDADRCSLDQASVPTEDLVVSESGAIEGADFVRVSA